MDLRGNRFVRQDSPAFRLRDGGAFDDANLVAHLELVQCVMRPVFLGRTNDLVQHGVLEAALDQDSNGLFVLVAGDAALQDAFGQGPGSLDRGRGFRRFLVQDGLHARHVAAHRTHPGGAFQLAGGLLEAEVEGLFLQRNRLVFQLVGRLRFQFLRFHAPLPFNITGEPLHRRATLIPGGVS